MGVCRIAAILGLPALLAAQSGEAMLAKVDRLRNPLPLFSVELSVQDGKREMRWKVFARENGDARVEGLSEKEKGRAVLVLGDDMWLLLPNSKRPLKVSPQQRLLGPASGGDLARTRFAVDYSVSAQTDETLDGTACTRLDLQARRPSISFRSVRLWVRKGDGNPLKAEFVLPSGKLSKIVRYGAVGTALGHPVLSAMTVEDPRGPKAQLRFDHWAAVAVDPACFLLPEPK